MYKLSKPNTQYKLVSVRKDFNISISDAKLCFYTAPPPTPNIINTLSVSNVQIVTTQPKLKEQFLTPDIHLLKVPWGKSIVCIKRKANKVRRHPLIANVFTSIQNMQLYLTCLPWHTTVPLKTFFSNQKFVIKIRNIMFKYEIESVWNLNYFIFIGPPEKLILYTYKKVDIWG